MLQQRCQGDIDVLVLRVHKKVRELPVSAKFFDYRGPRRLRVMKISIFSASHYCNLPVNDVEAVDPNTSQDIVIPMLLQSTSTPLL